MIRLRSDELEKVWQGLGDYIWILDLTEAQDRDESKRQMMLTRVHLQMEAKAKIGQNTDLKPLVPSV